MNRIHFDAHLLFDALYLAMAVYIARTWVLWFRHERKTAGICWRNWMAVIGFVLSSISLLLIVALSIHSAVTDGFRPYQPALMTFYLAGFGTSLAAVIAGVIGTGQLEKPTYLCSLFCFLIWLGSAIAM